MKGVLFLILSLLRLLNLMFIMTSWNEYEVIRSQLMDERSTFLNLMFIMTSWNEYEVIRSQLMDKGVKEGQEWEERGYSGEMRKRGGTTRRERVYGFWNYIIMLMLMKKVGLGEKKEKRLGRGLMLIVSLWNVTGVISGGALITKKLGVMILTCIWLSWSWLMFRKKLRGKKIRHGLIGFDISGKKRIVLGWIEVQTRILGYTLIGVRVCVNVTAGEIVLSTVGGIDSWVVGFFCFVWVWLIEFTVSLIQGYVFKMLIGFYNEVLT